MGANRFRWEASEMLASCSNDGVESKQTLLQVRYDLLNFIQAKALQNGWSELTMEDSLYNPRRQCRQEAL